MRQHPVTWLHFAQFFLKWYKSKNYTSTVLTKEHYHMICEFCEQIIDGVDCADLVCKGYIQAYKWAKKYGMLSARRQGYD